MNGELSTKGFKLIALHYKTDYSLTLNTSHILYHDGLNNVMFLWGQEPSKHETDRYETSVEMEIRIGCSRLQANTHVGEDV